MSPRTIGPARFAHFVRSALVLALGVPMTWAFLQGCATSNSLPTGSGNDGGEAGAGGSGQTGGMASSSSSSSTASSSSGMGGAGGGFTPPAGTADYPSETESNDVAALADPFVSSTKGFTGSIYPVGDIDVFEVGITVPGTNLVVKISDGKGGCPAGLSATLRVDGPNGLIGAEGGACPQLSPASTPGMSNLTADKHFVKIESASFSSDPFYVVEIALELPVCGNGILQGVEQCDDGNTNAGDGCTAGCKFEGTYINESEPNHPIANANAYNGADGAIGSITPIGDHDFYSFDVTAAGSSVVLELGDGFMGCPAGFDSELSLYSPSGTLIVSDDDDGADACSRISPTLYPQAANLPAGKYTAKVNDFFDDATQASYVLKIKVLPPGCGDLVRVDPEQCDDGNTMSGDGCSATCMSESPWEVETNDTSATATPLWAGTNLFKGAITPVGDVDYFSFVLPAGKKPVLETHDINNAMACGADTEITLLDSMGTVIATDNDNGIASCSLINDTHYPAVNNLPPGTYYVRVNEYMSNAVIGSYQLDVKFQ